MSNFPINVVNISFEFDRGSLSNRVIVFIRYMFNSILSFFKKRKKRYTWNCYMIMLNHVSHDKEGWYVYIEWVFVYGF